MENLKASPCGEGEALPRPAQTEKILEMLERRGVVPDQDITNDRVRAAEQTLRKNMYHNTMTMLKSYRSVIWALECFPQEIAQELNRPLKDLDALLSAVDIQMAMGNARLEHKLMNIQKTRILVNWINDALTVLRQKPGNGQLMYDIIYQTYITPDELNHAEILYRVDISDRHYYRLRQQAINILSIRLWSAPAGCLDAWLEILTLLEGL